MKTPREEWNFATLIAPLQPDEFFDKHWERTPVHIAAQDRSRFSLFSRTEMDRILAAYGRLASSEIRLLRYDNNREEIIDVGAERRSVDLDRIFAAYCDGYTINLNDVHSRHVPIRELANSISDTFGCMVNVNAYLTPAQSQGFTLHFDAHSVLILQIEGAKTWRIYPPRFPYPTPTHKPPHSLLRDLPGGPFSSMLLEPGDVLYVPRGFGHEASTDEGLSLHLTVGIHDFTYFDVVQEALTVLGWDLPLLRQNVSRRARAGQEEACIDLEPLRALLAEKLPLEEALELLGARRLAARAPATADRFSAMEPHVIKNLHAGSRVRKRPGTPCQVIEGSGSIVIQFPSHAVDAPLAMWPALEYIAQSEEFIISSLPGYASEEEKVALVRRLVAEGLLLPVVADVTL
jgi:ribosomal protein L16 Arg81 hydroxylase